MKVPLVVPSVVLLFEVVGVEVVLQQIPEAVMTDPPFDVIVPPALAAYFVILDAAVVVSDGAIAIVEKLVSVVDKNKVDIEAYQTEVISLNNENKGLRDALNDNSNVIDGLKEQLDRLQEERLNLIEEVNLREKKIDDKNTAMKKLNQHTLQEVHLVL